MNILLTGRSGQIGSKLYDYLSKSHNIFSLGRSGGGQKHYAPCDLTSLESTKRVVDQINPDIVLHFAANPIVKHDTNKPNDLLMTNVIGTNNLLHCLKPNTRVIFASSIVVYNEHTFIHDERSPLKAKSLYAASKIACENLLHSYKEYKNINYTILRLGATIGSKLTHGLIFDILRKLKENPTLELLGNEPGSIKPYTHIDDVIQGINLVLEKGPEIMNLCVPDPISVKTVAETVMKTLNISKEIVWNPANWAGDNAVLHGYSALARSLGWNPKYSSCEAIERTIHDHIK